MKASLREHGWPVLLLAVVAIGFFWQTTVGGKVLLPADNLYQFPPWSSYAPAGFAGPHNPLISDSILQNYGWKQFLVNSIHQRQLPLWNPDVLGGTPFFAPGQASVLYPFTALFLVLPVAAAYGWFAALHLFLAGLFAYAYLRFIGRSRWAGLIGGTTFMFSSRLVTSILWPQMMGAMVYLPLLLLLLELIVRQARRRWPLAPASAGAIVLGTSLLAGHIEVSVYVIATLGLYAAGRLIALALDGEGTKSLLAAARAAASCLVLVVLGVGLALVQLLPFSQVGQLNFRSGTVTYQDVVGFALKLPQLFAFLMPNFYGNPTMPATPGWGPKDYVEQAAYVGVLPLLLAGATLRYLIVQSRHQNGGGQPKAGPGTNMVPLWCLWAIIAVSLLLAFGTPLYHVIFFDLPGFNQIHTPFRWLIPYTAAVSLLAGAGFDLLRPHLRHWRLAFTGLALLALLLLPAWQRVLVPRLHVPPAYRGLELRNYAIMLVLLALAAAIAWLGSWLEREHPSTAPLVSSGPPADAAKGGLAERGRLSSARLRTHAFGPLALLLVLGDLIFFGITFNTASSTAPLRLTPPAVRFLQHDRSLFRITAYGQNKLLQPNGAMLYGLQDARGYDSVILARYATFSSLIEPQDQLAFNRVKNLDRPSALDSPLLSLLNVKYVLATAPIHDPRDRLVFTGRSMLVYQNLAVLPRAFVAPTAQTIVDPAAQLRALSSPSFNPARRAIVDGPLPAGFGGDSARASGASASIDAYSGRKVSIHASGPGLLVLSDTNYPGWTVKVDGQPARLYTADYAFRGVALGPGSHDVEFVFSPSIIKLGALGSALSLAAIILVLAFSAWLGAAPGRQPRLQGHTASRVTKNALSPMASNFITKILSFGFTIYYFPLFGVTQVGKYGVAVIVNLFMDTIISFGLQQLLMRDLARDKGEANEYITTGIAIRLALTGIVGLPVIAAVLALHRFAGFEADTTWVIVILTASFIPSAFATVFSSVFDGFELMEYRAGVNVLSGFLTVIFGVLFINLGWNIVGLAAAALLTNVLTAIAFYLLICRVVIRPRLTWNGARLRYLLRSAWPVMVSQLLVVLFFNIDVPILRAFRGSFEVGLYTTAYKFVSAMLIVPPAFVTAVFPILSRQAISQRDALRRGFDSSVKVLLIVAFPVLAGFEVLAGTIVVGLYGSQFAGAVPALRILMLFLPFSYVNGLTQYVLIALDKQSTIVRFFGITALFNIAVNLALIPSLGYIAASLVTVASEVVLLVPLCWLTARELGRLSLLNVASKPAIAAGLAGLAMLATPRLLGSAGPIPVLLLAILCGAAVYTAALLALRTFTAEERRLARSLLRRGAPEHLTAVP